MVPERKKIDDLAGGLADIFHRPPQAAWLIRSCCLIFASNLASTIIRRPRKSAISWKK